MARWRRDAGKEQRWRRAIARWRRSGLTIRDFCAAEGLAEHNFHAWRRTLAERDRVTAVRASTGQRRPRRSGPPRQPVFLPVQVLAEPAAHAEVEILLRGGRVLRLHRDFAPATLRMLITTLEALPGVAAEERPC